MDLSVLCTFMKVYMAFEWLFPRLLLTFFEPFLTQSGATPCRAIFGAILGPKNGTIFG